MRGDRKNHGPVLLSFYFNFSPDKNSSIVLHSIDESSLFTSSFWTVPATFWWWASQPPENHSYRCPVKHILFEWMPLPIGVINCHKTQPHCRVACFLYAFSHPSIRSFVRRCSVEEEDRQSVHPSIHWFIVSCSTSTRTNVITRRNIYEWQRWNHRNWTGSSTGEFPPREE